MDTADNFEGYLDKTASGIFKNRLRIWMVLDNQSLGYYKDNTKSVCIGSIDIHDIQTCERKGNKLKIHTRNKTFKFISDSEELASAWVKAIKISMSNKHVTRSSSQQSSTFQEIRSITPKRVDVFGVTLKPTQMLRVSEISENTSHIPVPEHKQSSISYHSEKTPPISAPRHVQSKVSENSLLTSEMPTSEHVQSKLDTFELSKSQQTSVETSVLSTGNLEDPPRVKNGTSECKALTTNDQISSECMSNNNNDVDSSSETSIKQIHLDENMFKSPLSDVLEATDAGLCVISSSTQSTQQEAFAGKAILLTKNKNMIKPPSFKPPPPPNFDINRKPSPLPKLPAKRQPHMPPNLLEETLKQVERAKENSPLNSSNTLSDLPTTTEQLFKISVDDQTNKTNTLDATLVNQTTMLTVCQIDQCSSDSKTTGNIIPINLTDKHNIISVLDNNAIHMKDNIKVHNIVEFSTISENEDEVSDLQMRSSLRDSVTEKQDCAVAVSSDTVDTGSDCVKMRKPFQSRRTVGNSPATNNSSISDTIDKSCSNDICSNDTINNNITVNHEIKEQDETISLEEDRDISTSISTLPSNSSNLESKDNNCDAINSVLIIENDADVLTNSNASMSTVSFESFYQLYQYFKARSSEEFNIENHSISSPNSVEILTAFLERNHHT